MTNRHHPYHAHLAREVFLLSADRLSVVTARAICDVAVRDPLPKQAQKHSSLQGRVTFITDTELQAMAALRMGSLRRRSHPPPPSSTPISMFAGQLPYTATLETFLLLLEGLCGVDVIGEPHVGMKWIHRLKDYVSTGCVYFALDPSDEDRARCLLRGRVLVDVGGVWYAQTDAERDALDLYMTTLPRVPNPSMPAVFVLERGRSQTTTPT